MKLLETNDEKLRIKCSEVTDFENIDYYKKLIEEMSQACIAEYAYGCAAPQFGILKRFILVMTVEEMKANSKEELENKEIHYTTMTYFNPRITEMRGKQVFYEACMSTGDTIGKVERPYYIEFEAQDINGNWLCKSAEGFEAILLCHELDHLDGIEFIDKATDIRYDADLEERIKIRRQFPHQIISKDGEFSQDLIMEHAKTLKYNK